MHRRDADGRAEEATLSVITVECLEQGELIRGLDALGDDLHAEVLRDVDGRYGFWEQGFPPSGPFDMWSFRLANILVGNAPDAAGLECQFMGPTLRFSEDCLIALCGAEMNATLDGEDIPQWESLTVAAGQTLACGFASIGARAYLATKWSIAMTSLRTLKGSATEQLSGRVRAASAQ